MIKSFGLITRWSVHMLLWINISASSGRLLWHIHVTKVWSFNNLYFLWQQWDWLVDNPWLLFWKLQFHLHSSLHLYFLACRGRTGSCGAGQAKNTSCSPRRRSWKLMEDEGLTGNSLSTKVICSTEALVFFHILPSKILFPQETSVFKLKFLAD